MALDHCDEQYNAWKLKLMYKIKNIERCQLFRMWFVEMGIQMFFWKSESEYMRLFSFPKNPFLNAHLQKFVYLWVFGLEVQNTYSELTQKKSDRNKNPQKPPVGEQASSPTIQHDFTTAEIKSLFQIYPTQVVYSCEQSKNICNFADGLSSTQTEETIRHINSLFSLQF